MISIKPKVVDSPDISHPAQTGTNYVEYNVTHDLGVIPTLTRLFVKYSGRWTEAYDWAAQGDPSTYYGYLPQSHADIKTQLKVRVYRVGGSTFDIKFRFIAMGEL